MRLQDPEAPVGVVPAVVPESGEAPAAAGRYAIGSEIARGGVGVVFFGVDRELGRDVALKILLERHIDNPALVDRFFREARISGQLQHPGVVPVYDVGLRPDRRPFFSMKLVRGETLAALLAGSDRSAAARRRFLGIFEKVLDAVAYAHACGVIHRDLKPSNIMVGTFGEVQVMDWGLSKVLADRESSAVGADTAGAAALTGESDARSQVGEVMGTLAYMPPEQARGEVDRIDARSDVFSLGAILCEILTGKPPYAGDDAAAVRAEARNARLERAHAELRTCGADRDLVRIAARCLRPAREARYANARELATAFSTYLASLDERARKAEIEAAEARVKATEERRARRLTLALAAAILLAILAAGTAYFWLDASRRSRISRTTAAVTQALEDVAGLRGAARAASVEDVAPWDKALDALHRAEALAAQGDIDPSTRARLASLAAALRAEDSRARAASAQALKDRAMVGRLTRIESTWGGAIEWDRKNRAYREAFLEYGIDVEAESPEAVASRIVGSRIVAALGEAIERWHDRPLLCNPDTCPRCNPDTCPSSAPVNPPIRSRLMEILTRIARHPLCEAVSSAATAGDWSAVTALIDEGSLGASISYLIDKLARWIAFSRGDVESAISLLRACYAKLPGDFWVNYRLGEFLARHSTPPDFEEALQHFRAAAAVRPDSALVWFEIGWALHEQGKIPLAQAAYRRVSRLDPDSAAPLVNLGISLSRQSKHEEALALYREALRLDPENPYAHFSAGQALGRLNRTEEAAEAYRATIRSHAGHFRAYNNLGNILNSQGQKAEALAMYEKALSANPRYAVAMHNLGDVKQATGDLDGAVTWYQRYMELQPDALAYWRLGVVRALQGEVRKSIQLLEKATALDADCWQAWSWLGQQLAYVDITRAVDTLRRAAALNPRSATCWNNLGYALLLDGRFDDAVHAYRRVPPLLDAPDSEVNDPSGLESLKQWFPTALHDCERAAELAPHLDEYLRGQRRADGPRDRFVLAKVCMGERRFAAATRFSMAAFDAALEHTGERDARERAASGAARAARGDGTDAETASAEERRVFRANALQWLRDELSSTTKRVVARGSRKALNEAVRTLKEWKTRPDFAGVREPPALAGLSEEERSEIHAFWKEVDAALVRLGEAQQRVGYDFEGDVSGAPARPEMGGGPAVQQEEGCESESR